MAPAIAAALARGIRQLQAAPRLSDREREVLAQGLSNPEIGRRLPVTEATA
jgi:DNA-binding NarL/FixJ family response regulator